MTLDLLQWISPAVIIGVMLYLHRLTGAATFLSPGERSDPIPLLVTTAPPPTPKIFLRYFSSFSVMECIEFTKPAHDKRDESFDRYRP